MNRKALIILTAASALLLAGLTTGCKKLEARDNLNKGVQAFKGAKYGDAVEFFKKAIDLDPTYPTARLYLATSYMSQYIPGADSPENNAFADQAAANFKTLGAGVTLKDIFQICGDFSVRRHLIGCVSPGAPDIQLLGIRKYLRYIEAPPAVQG